MADLIVIGYDDEKTAEEAAREVERLTKDLIIEPEAVAVIRRDAKGRYHVTTTYHEVATGAVWGMFLGLLFGALFFIPLVGLALGALAGALGGGLAKLGVSKDFEDEVKEMLQPGTSALFLVVDKVTPDKAVEALEQYGGRVLKTSLPKEAEQQLQLALEGATSTA